MTHYEIKQYTIDQAKKYGYVVKLSSNKKKKLDVYKGNVKILSFDRSAPETDFLQTKSILAVTLHLFSLNSDH